MSLKPLIKAKSRALWLVALVALPTVTVAADPLPMEYKLKAVFLLNFAKFVHWPSSAFAETAAPFHICIIGDDPFGPLLDQVVQGETVQNHPLAVVRPTDVSEYASCHIAFFSPSTERQVPELLRKDIGPYTFTVGEHEKFLEQGGMVNFTLEATKVRFVINTSPLSHAKFEVSSKLLSLGRAEQY